MKQYRSLPIRRWGDALRATAAIGVLGLGSALPAYATAEANAEAGAGLVITSIADEFFIQIPPPAGLQVLPSTTGPSQATVEQSGVNTLAFGGAAVISGSGVPVVIDLQADVNATADPAGVAEGIETVTGSIQLINNSGSTVVAFWSLQSEARGDSTVDDTALETAETFTDIEFSLNPGGSPTSPCNSPLLIDDETTTSAPPDDSVVTNPVTSGSITLPDGETCSLEVLLEVRARAEAQPRPVPATGPLALVALALLLAVAAFWQLRTRGRPPTVAS